MTHLSVQISHLVSARPMSVTMGNAIRQLKLEISDSDIDLPEQDVCSCLALYTFRSPDSHSFWLYRRRMRSVAKSTITSEIGLSLLIKSFKRQQ
jgi:translation initiation factor 2B subunit (eIF-2B alpha/beta/delta family)